MLVQDINEWPIIDPLPSYGRGRDAVGGRYSNLIMGYNLTDVVITGSIYVAYFQYFYHITSKFIKPASCCHSMIP